MPPRVKVTVMTGRPQRDTTLALAVLTFRRPDLLRGLLPMLGEQAERVRAAFPRIVDVQVLVIDNDPDKSAEVVVAAEASSRIRYVAEPTPGIAAARNRALDETTAADLLVYVDDDERPVDDWLAQLVGTYFAYDCAAVAGAVVSEFAGALDPWIVAGGFFQRRRPPTGTQLQVAATNNLLLDRAYVSSLGLRFDEEYGLTGGEDTLFTRTLVVSGAHLVWCNEAILIDKVPASRMTRGWVLRRALSSGNSWSLTAVAVTPDRLGRATTRFRLAGHGLIRAAGGSARWGYGAVTRSTVHRAKGLRTSARGVGMVLGIAGFRYQEYRRSRKSIPEREK